MELCGTCSYMPDVLFVTRQHQRIDECGIKALTSGTVSFILSSFTAVHLTEGGVVSFMLLHDAFKIVSIHRVK